MNTEEMRAMIAEELDLEDLAPDMQEKVIDQFTENALKRVTISLFERLPEDAKAEFTRLGDASDAEGVLKLFKDNIPNLDDFIRAEVKDEAEAFKKFQSGS